MREFISMQAIEKFYLKFEISLSDSHFQMFSATQKAQCVVWFAATGSAKIVQRKFHCLHGKNASAPSHKSVKQWFQKFMSTGSVGVAEKRSVSSANCRPPRAANAHHPRIPRPPNGHRAPCSGELWKTAPSMHWERWKKRGIEHISVHFVIRFCLLLDNLSNLKMHGY